MMMFLSIPYLIRGKANADRSHICICRWYRDTEHIRAPGWGHRAGWPAVPEVTLHLLTWETLIITTHIYAIGGTLFQRIQQFTLQISLLITWRILSLTIFARQISMLNYVTEKRFQRLGMDVVYLCYTRERHTVERADGLHVWATQLFSADCGPLFHSSPTPPPPHMQTAGINIVTLEYIRTNIYVMRF